MSFFFSFHFISHTTRDLCSKLIFFLAFLFSSRHRQGLITEPVSFALNVTQEEKVQHFFDEHPTSWHNLIHGMVAPYIGS